MKKRGSVHRTTVVVLLLIISFGIALTGAYQNGGGSASAATVSPHISSEVVKFLVATDFSPTDGDTEVALDKSVTVEFSMDRGPGHHRLFRVLHQEDPATFFTYRR